MPSDLVEVTYESLYSKFLETYHYEHNYLRVYGGPVEVEQADISKDGTLEILLNRTVTFPQELVLEDYNDEFLEEVPVLVPTEAEK